MNNFENIYLDIISESSLPDFSKIKYKFSLKPGPSAEDFKSFITLLKDEFKSSDEMTLENLYDSVSNGDYEDDDSEETKGSSNQPSNENGNSQQPKDETSKTSESSSSGSDDAEKSSSSTDQNSQK